MFTSTVYFSNKVAENGIVWLEPKLLLHSIAFNSIFTYIILILNCVVIISLQNIAAYFVSLKKLITIQKFLYCLWNNTSKSAYRTYSISVYIFLNVQH